MSKEIYFEKEIHHKVTKTIFISGQYKSITPSGLALNIIKAYQAMRMLEDEGWVVYCPHLDIDLINRYALEEYRMEACLDYLKKSDSIFMLEKWEDSEGAKTEHWKANDWGMKVYYQSEGLP